MAKIDKAEKPEKPEKAEGQSSRQVKVRLPLALYDHLAQLADADMRSVANFIEVLLRRQYPVEDSVVIEPVPEQPVP